MSDINEITTKMHKKIIKEACISTKQLYDEQVWDEDRGGYAYIEKDVADIEVSFAGSNGYPDTAYTTIIFKNATEDEKETIRDFVIDAMNSANVGSTDYVFGQDTNKIRISIDFDKQ